MTRAKRGRPPKQRPERGAPIAEGMSHRDIAATGIMSRQQIAQALAVASIPKDELERLIESDNPPRIAELARIGRRHQFPAEQLARKTTGSDHRVKVRSVAGLARRLDAEDLDTLISWARARIGGGQ